MGLLDDVRGRLVHEPGVAFVDSRGRRWGTVPANTSGKGRQTMTSEYEIMRGDVVRILHESAKDDARFVFGTTVEGFDQDEDRVLAHFSDGTSEEFDVLIGADGQGSHIRRDILPAGAPDPYRPVGIHMAYWFVPRDATDSDIRETYSAPGRRMIMRRSHNATETQVYFALWERSEEATAIHRRPAGVQKRFWADRFRDAGWQTERFIAGMRSADFFYSQEVVQVRTGTWSRGRVALVGDAGYCPSPYSGMGTSAGLVGAYVLAGEICRTPHDVPAAFARYHTALRPFVDTIQAEVNPRLLRIGFPKGRAGIRALLAFGAVGSLLRLPELAARFAKEDRGGAWPLPDYPELTATPPCPRQSCWARPGSDSASGRAPGASASGG
jgi:2-polyprenyl-6-methoxyphenol hydroxylase-like FAD-dependent oxidoreductase